MGMNWGVRIWDKQEKIFIDDVGIFRNNWETYYMDLPGGYVDTFDDPREIGGGDEIFCAMITDRFIVELRSPYLDIHGQVIHAGDKINSNRGAGVIAFSGTLAAFVLETDDNDIIPLGYCGNLIKIGNIHKG